MKVGNQGIVLAAVLGLCGIAPCRLPRCSGSDAPSVRLRALPVLYCESSRGGREVRVKLTAWNRATDGPIQRTANSEPFEEVARRAQEALEADRFPEAVRLYERATKLRPDWPEGWWHLGTLLFDAGRFAEARDAFAHFVSVERRQPGPGFGMLGLSQFQLKQYHKALAALEQGQKVGLGTDPAFVHKVLLHDGILNTLLGKPEVALQRLNLVANLTAAAHPEAPTDSVFQDIELLDAFGTAALRIPKLPSDVTSAQMPVVRRAGRAQAFIALQDRVAAEAEFKQLLALYPSEPGVHYMYGVFLLKEHPPLAVDEFRREIEVSPSHDAARIQLALEFLRTADYEQGLKYAREAVALAPGNFVAHVACGRLWLALGKTDPALQELRTAVKLAPGSPEAHFALSRALAEAGQDQEAARERAEFERLKALADAADRQRRN
jgi:tetratricopeptide (TPR) repeat protein